MAPYTTATNVPPQAIAYLGLMGNAVLCDGLCERYSTV